MCNGGTVAAFCPLSGAYGCSFRKSNRYSFKNDHLAVGNTGMELLDGAMNIRFTNLQIVPYLYECHPSGRGIKRYTCCS